MPDLPPNPYLLKPSPTAVLELPGGTEESSRVREPRHRGLAPPFKKGQSGNPGGFGRHSRPARHTLAGLGRSLWGEIEHVLAKDSGHALLSLANSIVLGAIERNPACLAFLGPRLAPMLDPTATTQRVVIQGIRLEVQGAAATLLTSTTTSTTSETSQTVACSDAAVSEQESQGGAPPQDPPQQMVPAQGEAPLQEVQQGMAG